MFDYALKQIQIALGKLLKDFDYSSDVPHYPNTKLQRGIRVRGPGSTFREAYFVAVEVCFANKKIHFAAFEEHTYLQTVIIIAVISTYLVPIAVHTLLLSVHQMPIAVLHLHMAKLKVQNDLWRQVLFE